MINFACKEFDFDEIVKCGLGITKAEHSLLNYLIKHSEAWFTTEDLSKKTKLNLSTVQRGVKKLFEQRVLERSQNNLAGGGYIFIYKIKEKTALRKILTEIIQKWAKRVEAEINNW